MRSPTLHLNALDALVRGADESERMRDKRTTAILSLSSPSPESGKPDMLNLEASSFECLAGMSRVREALFVHSTAGGRTTWTREAKRGALNLPLPAAPTPAMLDQQPLIDLAGPFAAALAIEQPDVAAAQVTAVMQVLIIVQNQQRPTQLQPQNAFAASTPAAASKLVSRVPSRRTAPVQKSPFPVLPSSLRRRRIIARR